MGGDQEGKRSHHPLPVNPSLLGDKGICWDLPQRSGCMASSEQTLRRLAAITGHIAPEKLASPVTAGEEPQALLSAAPTAARGWEPRGTGAGESTSYASATGTPSKYAKVPPQLPLFSDWTAFPCMAFAAIFFLKRALWLPVKWRLASPMPFLSAPAAPMPCLPDAWTRCMDPCRRTLPHGALLPWTTDRP